ncbi:MAG: hypothetical protein QGI46_03780 [Planctomycetota bacterium]|nr:hypothetical protein [Planctomycetota bacterium]
MIDVATNPRRGLEQGLVLTRCESTARARSGIRVVLLEPTGDLDPEIDDRGEELALIDRAGETVSRIGGLEAHDRGGRRVPVRFAMNRGRLRIEIADEEAEYPIRVQPRSVEEEEQEEEGREGRLIAGSKRGSEAQEPHRGTGPAPQVAARPAS